VRLWALLLCTAILVVCAIFSFGVLFERYIPTEKNDHLLDNVKGLGGPKR